MAHRLACVAAAVAAVALQGCGGGFGSPEKMAHVACKTAVALASQHATSDYRSVLEVKCGGAEACLEGARDRMIDDTAEVKDNYTQLCMDSLGNISNFTTHEIHKAADDFVGPLDLKAHLDTLWGTDLADLFAQVVNGTESKETATKETASTGQRTKDHGKTPSTSAGGGAESAKSEKRGKHVDTPSTAAAVKNATLRLVEDRPEEELKLDQSVSSLGRATAALAPLCATLLVAAGLLACRAWTSKSRPEAAHELNELVESVEE